MHLARKREAPSEEFNGIRSLRDATADLMWPSCVYCHNRHLASPKTD
jgi:hypothetical protein